jgi:hypothetical protein
VKKLTLCIGLGALPLLADFSYQEKSQMTGGAAVNMMKALGPFMKKAREPITSAVYIKGNKMANVSNDSAHIVDLDAETMTDINFQKRTYTVITFAQMKEAMEKAMARVQQQPQQPAQPAPDPKAKLDLKIDVKETGQQKNISGIDCKEVLMTTTMEATSTENGQKGTITTTMDVWVGPYPAGYKEVTDFYMRMGKKMAANMALPSAAVMTMNPQFASAAGEMAKEAQKLEGMHVLTVTRMTGAGDGTGGGQSGSTGAPQQQQPQAKAPDKGSIADAALRGQLGRIGLGGLGRRKKTEDTPPPPPPADQQQPAQPQAQGDGVLMEMTSEQFGWTSAPVDPAKFQVPGGYKQEEHPMLKNLK